MGVEDTIGAWLPLVGGLSGAAMLCYFVLMVYHSSRKTKEITALRRELGELRGMLLVIASELRYGRRR